MDPNNVDKFKTFIETCQKTPEILWIPELKFFRDFIESLGGTIPKISPNKSTSTSKPSETMPDESEKMDESTPLVEESEESDIELENEGVLEPEMEEFPEMGDGFKIVSEDDEIAAGEKRSEAMAAMSEGDLSKAVNLLTEAIKINSTSAMLYAKRANILLKQKRVKAALRDCDEAIRLNPDSATAHKFRGRAYRLLGQWLEAAQDLRLACKLDFDEQSHEWLKEVTANASKIEDHNRKYERKRQDKLQKEKIERVRKAKEEHKKAQERQDQQNKSMPGGFPGMPGGFPGMPGGFPGGFPGMPGGFPGGMPGGFPGGTPGGMPGTGGAPPSGMPRSGGASPGGMPGNESGGMPNISELINDPDLVEAMQDPDVAAAFQDVSTNPSNILKYKDNPKVSAVINKLMKKFAGGSMPGFAGGAPPPAGGCPAGFGSEPPTDPKASTGDDLD